MKRKSGQRFSAAIIVEIFNALRYESPAAVAKRYGTTARNLERWKSRARRGIKMKSHLRALWWLDNRTRIEKLRARGLAWHEIVEKTAPPSDLFKVWIGDGESLRAYAIAEWKREEIDLEIKDEEVT